MSRCVQTFDPVLNVLDLLEIGCTDTSVYFSISCVQPKAEMQSGSLQQSYSQMGGLILGYWFGWVNDKLLQRWCSCIATVGR
jgi:hypothetical protein